MKKKIDIEYIANLARIRLNKDQIKNFSSQLDEIISYVEKLNKVDTNQTQPTTHPLALKNVFREDKIESSLPVEKVLKNAPQRRESFFKVPKVIEKA